jgi:hypothetical protein
MRTSNQLSLWYTNWQVWLIIICCVGILGFIFSYAYLANLRQAISLQESLLMAASNTLLSNTSSVSINLIRCTRADQQQYDALLSTIDTLSATDLILLKQVYPRCAYQQPHAMQAQLIQLNASFDAYESLVKLYATQSLFNSRYNDDLQMWQSIITTEMSRVRAVVELHTVQEDIIDTLLVVEADQSERLLELQAQALTAQNAMRTLRLEVDSLRAQLD